MFRTLAVSVCCSGLAAAQWFAGASGGVATLSADGSSSLDATQTVVSAYKPENGAAFEVFGGRHINDILSIQAAYVWNRNALTFTGASFSGGRDTSYEQARDSSQQAGGAQAMIYFRSRRSRFRPYVSGGAGIAHLVSHAGPAIVAKGAPLPAETFSASSVYWRTAVGLDARLRKGWWLRYAFGETLSANGLSKRLLLPGERHLLNFQSQFGFVRVF